MKNGKQMIGVKKHMMDDKQDKRKYRVITKEMQKVIESMYYSGKYESIKQIADVMGLKQRTVQSCIQRIKEEKEEKELKQNKEQQEQTYIDELMQEWHKVNLWYYKYKRNKQQNKTNAKIIKGGACRYDE